MGMTLWIQVLEGREYFQNSDDHTLMHQYSEALDQICEAAHLSKLSDYFDFADLTYSYSEDCDEAGEAEDDGNPQLDPETGLGYGIDDMQWFDAAAGYHCLQVLADLVQGGALPELSTNHREQLIEELADCLSILEAPATRGARFHLAVIE